MYDWFEQNGYADEIIEPVWTMFICEVGKVYLRPNTNYRFEVSPTCSKCVDLASVYEGR